MEKGALWNCGVFAFRLSFMLERLGAEGSSGAVEDWAQRYAEMTEKSFDEEVVERSASRAACLCTRVYA